jgi:AcrR family transcriptional regulator
MYRKADYDRPFWTFTRSRRRVGGHGVSRAVAGAARRVFLARGYASATLDAIAE